MRADSQAFLPSPQAACCCFSATEHDIRQVTTFLEGVTAARPPLIAVATVLVAQQASVAQAWLSAAFAGTSVRWILAA